MEFKPTFNKPVFTPPAQKPTTAVVDTQPVGLYPTDAQKAKWNDPAQIVPLGQQYGIKLTQIATELKSIIVERDDLIDDIMTAIATGNHIVLLGEPGIAKSLLSRSICDRIVGGNYFEWLLNKTSDPSAILGPYSIKKLEQDKFVRKTTGKLPEAHIAFLDEILTSLLV